MKKRSMFFGLLSLFLFPSFVNAADVVNSNNVIISETDYINFRKIYSEAYLDTMTQSRYDELRDLNLDFDTLQTDSLYEVTYTDSTTGIVTSRYVTKEQYEAAKLSSTNQMRSSLYGTASKQIYISLVRTSDTSAFVSVTATWWTIPSKRSYDVIGLRTSGIEVVNGSQAGQQLYKLSGASSYTTISYAYNGTNINNQDNGFGISMNIVNSNIVDLECNITASLYTDAFPATVYGSYQHATSNISLAVSKSYTLTSSGIGQVFKFSPSSYGAYFDGMQGVDSSIYS